MISQRNMMKTMGMGSKLFRNWTKRNLYPAGDAGFLRISRQAAQCCRNLASSRLVALPALSEWPSMRYCQDLLHPRPERPGDTGGLIGNGRKFSSKKTSDKDKEDECEDKDGACSHHFELENHRLLLQQYQLDSITERLKILVIQPHFKKGPLHRTDTTVDLMLEETLGLVKTLEWEVLGHSVLTADSSSSKDAALFGEGQLESIRTAIDELEVPRTEGDTPVYVSAVFVSTFQLNSVQRIGLEEALGKPVLDRYNVVLQIFKRHAHSREAKLQIALAEIPYLHQRLMGDYEIELVSKHDPAKRKGEAFFANQRMLLARRERKIRQEMEKLRAHRQLTRKNRRLRLKIPSVAIVGYTNCGKTSLIKALTKDPRLQPRDALFATLDVTVHSLRFPATGLGALLVDTVGFISDIPTQLIASFDATLEDAKLADVVVHVRDVSNPDHVAQDINVRRTLQRLGIGAGAAAAHQDEGGPQQMITAGNKIDLLDPDDWKLVEKDGMVAVSCLKGHGMDRLVEKIEAAVIKATGRREMVFRFKVGAQANGYLRWLHKNVTVVRAEVDPSDPSRLLVTTLLKDYDLNRFRKNFFGLKGSSSRSDRQLVH